MEGKRYTNEGLPIMSRGSVNRYIEEQHNRQNAPSLDLGRLLQDDNPELFRYLNSLRDFYIKQGLEKEAESILIGAGIVYLLLKSQAEANNLENDLENLSKNP